MCIPSRPNAGHALPEREKPTKTDHPHNISKILKKIFIHTYVYYAMIAGNGAGLLPNAVALAASAARGGLRRLARTGASRARPHAASSLPGAVDALAS
ncbi:hypothetical protein [Aquabacter cavernae]|uniref:hypothetical protein n=1 Tax=Aquabacter cavernae TaxID=2496029 RepID=UPI000F8E3325|nr:hypothetical protein [Aquabacter cavernae]